MTFLIDLVKCVQSVSICVRIWVGLPVRVGKKITSLPIPACLVMINI